MNPINTHKPTDTPSEYMVIIDVIRKQILRWLSIFLIVVNVFLFLRFILRLFGANPENPFAAFIFILSTLFMLPFLGILPQFRDEIVAGQMAIDISALIAGFCYNILIPTAMVVIQIGSSILRMRKKAKDTLEKKKPDKAQPLGSSLSHNRF